MATTPAAPEPHDHDNHPELAAVHSGNGLILFAIYFALYAGFMVLATFFPAVMKQPVVGGVNVAIAYGMGLILAAFVLAAVYMFLCRRATGRHVQNINEAKGPIQ
jgi:uncharacterized membrane protein (DUF485 family)